MKLDLEAWQRVVQEMSAEISAGQADTIEDVGILNMVTSKGMLQYITPDDDLDLTPAEGWEKRIERILSEIEFGRFHTKHEPQALAFETSLGTMILFPRNGG